MAKAKTRYVCTNCGSVSSRWLGRCPQCGEWNTMTEEAIQPEPPKGTHCLQRQGAGTKPESLRHCNGTDAARRNGYWRTR